MVFLFVKTNFVFIVLCIFVLQFFFMKNFFLLVLFLFSFQISFSQNDSTSVKTKTVSNKFKKAVDIVENPKAKIEQYKIYSLEKDTTYVDTSLTIHSEYKYNYLRKDIFGLLPFANEGQPYTTLDFGINYFNAFPEFGFKAKHFNFLEVKDISYYSVATPLTELYFKTVMEQGQNVDILVALNTSERLNISVAYKGLRSLGKYINQLSSAGNFRLTASYVTKNNRYNANFHFTGQDLSNGENGGIVSNDDFESGNDDFKNRARLQVYFTDATSFLKGKRFFLDHQFKLFSDNSKNNLTIIHQFNLENKFFEFNQATLTTAIDETTTIQRFGVAFVNSKINDQTTYNRIYNKAGLQFENNKLGKIQFFVEDFNYVYKYDKIVFLGNTVIPNQLSQRINAVGGQYEYYKNNWKTKAVINKAISKQTFSTIDLVARYKFNNKNSFSAQYQNISKIPNNNYTLHQSSYLNYNWYNSFNNEKINNLVLEAHTQYLNISAQTTLLKNYLYFTNDDSTNLLQLISPKQYSKTINFISIKASKEFKFKKWALDNTLLYQDVKQDDKIINIPQFVARNTLYYSNRFFKKALYLQTGVTVNYFTKYYANDYNPVLGEFFVQQNQQIGNFPMLDFFINARIRQTRIFLKAEHFNSSFSTANFYNAPNYPYRDFIVRFGLVWNFFQ